MQHVAIDLGGKESQICVRAPDGTIVEEKRYPTRLLDKLIKGWPQSRVIVETSASKTIVLVVPSKVTVGVPGPPDASWIETICAPGAKEPNEKAPALPGSRHAAASSAAIVFIRIFPLPLPGERKLLASLRI